MTWQFTSYSTVNESYPDDGEGNFEELSEVKLHLGSDRILLPVGPRGAVGRRLSHEPEVLGTIPGPATYFRFFFH